MVKEKLNYTFEEYICQCGCIDKVKAYCFETIRDSRILCRDKELTENGVGQTMSCAIILDILLDKGTYHQDHIKKWLQKK